MPYANGTAAEIEIAAKYICNHHSGRCPMVVVNFPCPAECTLDTLAWRCWIRYFQHLAERIGAAAHHQSQTPNSGTFAANPA